MGEMENRNNTSCPSEKETLYNQYYNYIQDFPLCSFVDLRQAKLCPQLC